MSLPLLHRREINGLELACFEWEADLRAQQPTLFLSHATGFHGRVWDQVLNRLGTRHAIAVETRGHGRSENVEIEDWRDFGDDLVGWIDHFGLRSAIGVGHSAGGHAMVDAAAARPDAFERILLIDPVIASPSDYDEAGWQIDVLNQEVHPTAKRRNAFASVEAMIERFRDREPYRRFDPEAFRDYCQWALVPAVDDDGLVLACSPESEASVYMTSRTNPAVYDAIRALEIPVMILRAKRPPVDRDLMDFSSSPTWPGLVDEFRNGRERHLTEHTHFIPMEDPDLVARYVEQYDPEES